MLEINGVTLPLLPHQERFLGLDCRYPALWGGFGCGKSHIGLRKALSATFEHPGVVGLYTSLTYPLLRDAIIPEFFRILHAYGMVEGQDFTFNRSETSFTNHLARDPSTGERSKILFRPVDGPVNLARIIAVTAGWAIKDEADKMSREAHLRISERVRDKRCRSPFVASVGTPEGLGTGYELYVLEPSKRGFPPDEQYLYVRGRTMDNPNLDEGYVKSLFELYDEQLVKAYLEGHFVSLFEGLCFRFDEADHVSDEWEYDAHLPILASFDFNVNPMTCTLWHSHRGYIWAFDEIVLPTSFTEEVAREIRNRYGKPGLDHQAGILIYGDAGGRSRNTKAGSELGGHWTDYDIIREELYGMPGYEERVPKTNPLQRDSINAVNAKLKNGHGQVTLGVHTRCSELRRSFLATRYAEHSNPPKIEKGPDTYEHASDTARYVVWPLFPVSEEIRRGRATAARIGGRRAAA